MATSAGAALIVIGCTYAADHGLSSIAAPLPLGLGLLILAGATWHILYTNKNAVIPKVRPVRGQTAAVPDVQTLLTHRIPRSFLISTFCQSLMFIPSAFLLPQFFQGVGADCLAIAHSRSKVTLRNDLVHTSYHSPLVLLYSASCVSAARNRVLR